MVGSVRCRVGRHVWRKVETQEGEVCGECSRCGKRDWHRYDGIAMDSKWRSGPPGPNNTGQFGAH